MSYKWKQDYIAAYFTKWNRPTSKLSLSYNYKLYSLELVKLVFYNKILFIGMINFCTC